MGMLLPTALPEADRAVLVARDNRATSTQRDALRALIILTLDEHGVRATARLVGCATSTVVNWRDRYRQRGLAGLRDLPRSGAPRIHGDEQRRRVAGAGTSQTPRPWGSWPHAELAEHVNAAPVAGSGQPVSRCWVRRVLHEAHIRVHLVRGWLHRNPDPRFDQRIAAIEAAVADARAGRRTVLCLDEKTAVAVRSPCRAASHGPRGRSRRELEYRRRGS